MKKYTCKCGPVWTNSFGNTYDTPRGWKHVGRCGSKLLQQAKQEGRLVAVVQGWTGSRKWPRPILKNYACPHVHTRLAKEAAQQADKDAAKAVKLADPEYQEKKEARAEKARIKKERSERSEKIGRCSILGKTK